MVRKELEKEPKTGPFAHMLFHHVILESQNATA